MGLADNVRARRKKLGLSQDELIKKTGVTSVKSIETGKILSPHFPALVSIANALGVTVSDLFAEPKAPRKRKSAGGIGDVD
jgi:transcriptional regulator with XRE-family HTH domain